jgi:hypothetical protein
LLARGFAGWIASKPFLNARWYLMHNPLLQLGIKE